MDANLDNLLNQFHNLEQSFVQSQEKLAKIPVETSSGGIKISSNGTGEYLGLKIDPSVINGIEAKDLKALEDALLAALKQSKEDVQKAAQKELDQISGKFLTEN